MRLLWQESRFDPAAVRPAGAQGIAQFMPVTAAMRGLTNAFEPLLALRESASYLRELRTTFRGNLGLAAAAYNAGPGAVEAWLARRSVLPGRDAGLRDDRHGLCRGGLGCEIAAAAGSSAAPPSTPERGARCAEIAKSMIERTRQRRRSHRQPGLGAVGSSTCRQLDRSRCAGRLRAAAPQVRRCPRRPPAAGPRRSPACGRAVPRPGLGRELAGRERAVREAEGRGRQLHRFPQPAQLDSHINGLTVGIARPWSSADRTADASTYRYSSRRTSAHAAAAPWRAGVARPRRRSVPC